VSKYIPFQPNFREGPSLLSPTAAQKIGITHLSQVRLVWNGYEAAAT